MARGFIESPRFYKKWFEPGFSEDDLLSLELELLENPKAGPVIQGTGRLRKIRFSFENRGKSGSVRVLYVDFEEHARVFLLAVFAKNEKENLTKEERNNIKRAMAILEKELFRGDST